MSPLMKSENRILIITQEIKEWDVNRIRERIKNTCKNLIPFIGQLQDVKTLFVHTVLHEIKHIKDNEINECICDEFAFKALDTLQVKKIIEKVNVSTAKLPE